MRTFIAIELPDELADEVAQLARNLSAHVKGRFMPRETYHLTLAFLGSLDDAEVSRAMDALDTACAGYAPIELSCTGLGTFGRKNDATLWLGMAPNAGISELAEHVRAELDARSVPFDRKKFLPHITLARRARIATGALDGLAFPRSAHAETVTLFKSTLTPDGALYKPLYSVNLGEDL